MSVPVAHWERMQTVPGMNTQEGFCCLVRVILLYMTTSSSRHGGLTFLACEFHTLRNDVSHAREMVGGGQEGVKKCAERCLSSSVGL